MLTDLQPVVEQGPWAVALAVGASVVGRIVVIMIALRGSDPKDRPSIIKAVAELFWRRRQ